MEHPDTHKRYLSLLPVCKSSRVNVYTDVRGKMLKDTNINKLLYNKATEPLPDPSKLTHYVVSLENIISIEILGTSFDVL